MLRPKKTLVTILKDPAAVTLQEVIVAKGEASLLNELGDPVKAMSFLRTTLRGSYLFGRYAVPAYAAAVYESLTKFHPVDDEVGPLLEKISEAVRGELFNNNVFGRPGECHSHFHDALQSYADAGGEMAPVKEFLKLTPRSDVEAAMRHCKLWSPGSIRFAQMMMSCCEDPLTLFILMPANEEITPRIYKRTLATLCKEKRFDTFRHFLKRHDDLDEDEHGPVVLDWLDLYIKRAAPCAAHIRTATGKVLALFSDGPMAPRR